MPRYGRQGIGRGAAGLARRRRRAAVKLAVARKARQARVARAVRTAKAVRRAKAVRTAKAIRTARVARTLGGPTLGQRRGAWARGMR